MAFFINLGNQTTNMLRTIFLILIFISWTSCSFAQKANKWAIGISYGYKLNNGAVETDYNIINKLTCNANLSLDKYMGCGMGIGFYYYPFDKKFNPFAGIGYVYTTGTVYSDDSFLNIKIDHNSFSIPWIGICYNDLGKNNTNGEKNYFSYFLKLGYKYCLTTNTEAYVTNGPANKTLLERINGYKKDGIVISVGILYNF